MATVEVILDATIQVLTGLGLPLLTTARVAERAGVSVGSIYQYYPNKQALLMAVLERHLEAVIRAVESASAECRGRNLDAIAQALVTAYVDAKLKHPDTSRALYALPSSEGTDAIVARITARGLLAACDALASCRDARFVQPSLVASVWTGALMGPVQMLLTDAIPLERAALVKAELTTLSVAYLRAAAQREAGPVEGSAMGSAKEPGGRVGRNGLTGRPGRTGRVSAGSAPTPSAGA